VRGFDCVFNFVFEFLLGKKYSNLEEIYSAMVNRDVKGVLVDAYTVGSRKELFERKDLRISKIFDFSSAYGVVLGGESKKLQMCFNSYLSEQRSYISQIIERNIRGIEVRTSIVSSQIMYGHAIILLSVLDEHNN
jgi:hypothetical protein